MPLKISILILTHNRADDLLALLESLSLQADTELYLQEILILNNASTEPYDEVLTFIETHPSLHVNYISSGENLGVARGRNKLMKIAAGDLMLTIDDDMIFPDKQSLTKMSSLFEKDIFKESNTAVLTLRVIYFSNKQVQQSVFPHKKYGKYKDRHEFLTLYFAGGANLMKRELPEKVGYFPEDFFYGMEEYDLCYRIIGAGYTVGYDDSVTIEHKESPQGRQPNYNKVQMHWLNKSKVAWRYLPLVYFVSTSFAWSLRYLRYSQGHIGLFFKTWLDILRLPGAEPRKVVGKTAVDYLKKVEARLWY